MKVIQAEVTRDGESGRVAPQRLRMPAALRSLGHKNYRLFYGGQLISLTGTWMQIVAQSWLVYRLTGSAATLGFVAFAGQIPGFVLSPVGGVIIQIASSNTLVQAMAPDALRGRVMAVYSMMFLGMAPLGALLAGWTAERVGAANTVALGGAGCILSALIFSLRLPALRREARKLLVAEEGGGVAEFSR